VVAVEYNVALQWSLEQPRQSQSFIKLPVTVSYLLQWPPVRTDKDLRDVFIVRAVTLAASSRALL